MNTSNIAFSSIIDQLSQKQNLSQRVSYDLFNQILLNKMNPYQISSLLTALKMKGESDSELLGAIQSILTLRTPFPKRDDLVKNFVIADCCGTGGDEQNTLNVSTAVAFIASTQSIKIAKHGNKAVSSQCGTSDILSALGIDILHTPKQAYQQLMNCDLTFLHAPHYHPHVKSVSEVRNQLSIRTIFNLMGPLINPVQPPFQLIGVYDPQYTFLFAKLLSQQGVERALIIHGGGTDECAIHDRTIGHLVENNEITPFTLTPEAVGLKRYALNDIRGQDILFNKQALLDLLMGKGTEAYRAVVALNTGALFMITGVTQTIKQGVELAQNILASDLGYQKLLQMRDIKC